MQVNWYQHQKDLITLNPSKRLVAFGCGAGKTRTILQLAKNQGGPVLVVAPKTQVLDKTWEREMKSTGIEVPLTVISKERFKKEKPPCDVFILDEGHFALGVLSATRYRNKVEIPKTSQIFDEVRLYIDTMKPKAIYLASATPFLQPMALWAVATLFGENWNYFAFRRRFYAFIPVIGRGVWIPKKDAATEEYLKKLAHRFGSFGRLEDFFDVPDQVHKEVRVGITTEQKEKMNELPLLYPEPLALVGKRHQLEQGIFEGEMVDETKLGEIVELAREFPKLLVFARYTAQIDFLAMRLKEKFKKKKILVLDGRTKDRRGLLEMAEVAGKETIVIAQSQVSTGYELPSYRCTIFASMSYSFVDYEQACGRTQRANNISKNVYVYLLAGRIDAEVLRCVQGKKDFNEQLFIQQKEV